MQIFKLTRRRVGLARSRVHCHFCLLQLSFLLPGIHSWTRPVSAFFSCYFEVWMRVGAWRSAAIPSSLHLCWILLSLCPFYKFKLFYP
ncbi:hypothetical protein Hanom_Chr11g01041361 [Helianthus anomalus]